MFNLFKNWLTGSSEVEGQKSVHPNPSSIASVVTTNGYMITNEHPVNSFTDEIFSSFPVGYSMENPMNVTVYNTPKQKEVVATPTIRTTNAPKGRDC